MKIRSTINYVLPSRHLGMSLPKQVNETQGLTVTVNHVLPSRHLVAALEWQVNYLIPQFCSQLQLSHDEWSGFGEVNVLTNLPMERN
jgi:hypothetical protein